MILLNKRLTDLVSGYDRIRKADLPSKWRTRLLTTYAHRREVYEVGQSQRGRRMAGLNPMLAAGFVVTAVMFLGGLFLVEPQEWRMLLMLLGVVGSGLLGIVWLWKAMTAPPDPPQHPLQEPLKARLLPPLLSAWCEKLQGQLPAHSPYEGFTGEKDFVESLQRLQGNSSYIMYRLQQQIGDDVDVTVVGPKGVWVFEVKYWNGRIGWHSEVWSHEKSYYKPGGIPVIESKKVDQPPDQQWRRMADDVAETLRRRAPRLIAGLPILTKIKGGLVFTHPKATYDIARDCPCVWGTVDFWIQRLASAPMVPGMNELAVLRILDVLLARHRRVSGDAKVTSMYTHAAQLIQDSEARLAEWLQD